MDGIKRFNRRSGAIAGLGVALALLPAAAQAETLYLQAPKLDGVAIDRCLRLNEACDWPAANALCAHLGYDRALDWAWASMGRTRTIGSGEPCVTGDGMQCGGFAALTCARGDTAGPPTAPTTADVMPGDGPASGAGEAAPGLPAPTPPPQVAGTFTGTIRDYTLEADPSDGSWIVTDTRPGSPDGTVRVDPATPLLQFTDGSLFGPGSGAPGSPPLAPPGATTTGMTEDQIEEAYGATGFTPAAPPAPDTPSVGSGAIVARLERGPYDCFETGPSSDRLYVRCSLEYSLTNTSGSPIRWTTGEWQTPKSNGEGMDRRGVGYRHAAIQPGDTWRLKSFCIVPTGQGFGSWAAWGTGRYFESNDPSQFGWRLTTTCP